MSFQTDKAKEKKRYNQKASQILHLSNDDFQDTSWISTLHPVLRPPYDAYFHWIRHLSKSHHRHLDLCCGDGRMAAMMPANSFQCLADLSENSVRLAVKQNRTIQKKPFGVAADAETLPFADNSFDLVTCAGSLSYFHPNQGALEIRRVLKPGGYFICVDSLNHNWIYRVNRWVHYLLGRRTRSTLKRIPTEPTLNIFAGQIGTMLHVSYHGIFLFLKPLLEIWFSKKKLTRYLVKADQKYPFLKHWSFKFVMVTQKIR